MTPENVPVPAVADALDALVVHSFLQDFSIPAMLDSPVIALRGAIF